MSRADHDAAASPSILRRLLSEAPGESRGWRDLGLHTHDEIAFARSIALAPDDADAQGGVAAAMLADGRHRKAGGFLRRALALSPHRADLWQLASQLAYCHRAVEAAARTACRALAFDPAFAAARRSLHFASLLDGDLQRGAPALGVRFRPIPEVPLPLWRGETLAGRRLLVLGEEGFGDMIQMARFLPRLARQGAAATAVVPGELRRLFSSLDGIAVALDASPDAFDAWIPMMAVPEAAAIADTGTTPYLAAPKSGPGLDRFEGLTVGIAWRGRATHRHDAQRSLAPDALAPILAVPGVRFVSLDPGARLPAMLAPPLADFADTAFVMRQLDLVISADTAAVHLAGALGVPGWVLLADVPEWRWGTGGETSAWYPSLRLYRSGAGRSLTTAIAVAAADLARLAADRR